MTVNTYTALKVGQALFLELELSNQVHRMRYRCIIVTYILHVRKLRHRLVMQLLCQIKNLNLESMIWT